MSASKIVVQKQFPAMSVPAEPTTPPSIQLILSVRLLFHRHLVIRFLSRLCSPFLSKLCHPLLFQVGHMERALMYQSEAMLQGSTVGVGFGSINLAFGVLIQTNVNRWDPCHGEPQAFHESSNGCMYIYSTSLAYIKLIQIVLYHSSPLLSGTGLGNDPI
jgi:hypothetical protein